MISLLMFNYVISVKDLVHNLSIHIRIWTRKFPGVELLGQSICTLKLWQRALHFLYRRLFTILLAIFIMVSIYHLVFFFFWSSGYSIMIKKTLYFNVRVTSMFCLKYLQFNSRSVLGICPLLRSKVVPTKGC